MDRYASAHKELNDLYWTVHALDAGERMTLDDRARWVEVLEAIDNTRVKLTALGERWASGLSVG